MVMFRLPRMVAGLGYAGACRPFYRTGLLLLCRVWSCEPQKVIEWVTDYNCLIKNDDLFGVLPSTNELQNSKNVFALMQKIYDILSNIVRIQADHIYEKYNIAPHFQDFKFYISHHSKVKRYEAIWKKFEDVLMLRDSSTMHQRSHDIQHEITQSLGSIKGLYVQHPLVPKTKNKSITHEGPHEKRSALHDFEPIPDLLSLTGNEWIPPTDTTHPWG